MRLLVTGAAGFIGSNFVRYWLERRPGDHVVAYDLLTYAGALPLLQQAVQSLRGTGPSDPYEGFANYNLGYTLLQLGRCNEAIPYLQTAQRLEPQRSEPGQALKRAEDCSD